MSDTMKTLHILEPGRVVWDDAPIPQPGAGEVLLKVLSVTTCPHWDMHLMSGEPMFPGRPLPYPYPPGQPGHEAMGEVAALGPGVTGLAVGDRVVAWRDQGHHRPGCYAQYVVMVADNVLPLPPQTPPEDVTSLELAACVQVSFDQLARLDAVRGKRFGVSGLGPAGLVAVQMARAYGAAEVVGIDVLPERRALAAALGADRVLSPQDDALPAGRLQPTALDAAIDCTGLKVSIEYLMARTNEAVTIFGVLRETVSFGPDQWRGAFALVGYGTHNRAAAGRALQLALAGQLRLSPLITHRLPFTRYTEGVDLLRRKQAIKVCFDPWWD